jgi:Lon protease-like protein
MTLPLHIFEERYKQMIGLCLEESRPFGVVLIRAGVEVGGEAEPFEIGTTARIASVEHLDDGKFNLICEGGQRFRITATLSRHPYLVGEVETIASHSEDETALAASYEGARDLFVEYLGLYLAASNQWARSVEMPAEPDALADFIAARLPVDNLIKQRLLEELLIERRLEAETFLLENAIRETGPRVAAARASRWRGFSSMN